MPTIHKFDDFRFFFYRNEGNEPPHVHVSSPDGEMKIWLYSLLVDYSYRIKSSEEKIILKIIKNNRKRFLNEWIKFYERSF